MLLPVVDRQRALAVRRPDQRLDPDIARRDRDDRNAAVGIGAGRERPLDESGLDPFLSALLADADLADLGIAIIAGPLREDGRIAGKEVGKADALTQVTTGHLVCRLMPQKKNTNRHHT